MARSRTALWLPALIALPALVGLGYSLFASFGLLGAGADGFTTRHYERVFGASATWATVAWSLWTATVSTLIAATMAVEFSIRIPRDRGWTSWLLVPLAVPHVGAALAFVLLLGQSGLFARIAYALHLIAEPSAFPVLVGDRIGVGVITAAVWKEFPFLLLVSLAAAAQQLPQIAEAARTLGASESAIRQRISRPLLWRAIAPACVAVFAFVLGQYDLSALLAPSDPTSLSLLTLERWTDSALTQRGEAHVLGLIALLIVVVAVWWQATLRRTGETT